MLWIPCIDGLECILARGPDTYESSSVLIGESKAESQMAVLLPLTTGDQRLGNAQKGHRVNAGFYVAYVEL